LKKEIVSVWQSLFLCYRSQPQNRKTVWPEAAAPFPSLFKYLPEAINPLFLSQNMVILSKNP
jgi:hypothetical protein